jgi:hypothetical protein
MVSFDTKNIDEALWGCYNGETAGGRYKGSKNKRRG